MLMGDRHSHNPDAGEAFKEYGGRIYRYLLRRTRDPHDAEELTQKVFVDAAAALSSGTEPRSMLGWLYAVAERRFVDEVRRRSRSAEIATLVAPDAQSQTDSSYGPPVARALRRGLESLPKDQRAAVTMKLLEGRSFAEIADSTGASEAACKMRFTRGLKSLREFLEREGIGPG
jgi:RNA polymerase sigma-70 factor, ECF subfamily